MASMQQDSLQQLSSCLLQTLSPDINVRKPAEKFIESCESHDGFCQFLLQLIENREIDSTVRLCSSIVFKNFVRKYWACNDTEPDKVSQNDRNYAKNVIVNLMLISEEQVQRQLSEAISIIGREDFPERWPNLLENMTAKLNESCAQFNFLVISGVLQTANSLFKRYRFECKSQKLWAEIKFVLDTFAKDFTTLFVWIVKLIPQHADNASNMKTIFDSLDYCAKIFYSLNYQELPEFFEDNINVWMTHFVELLQINYKCLEAESIEEPGVLESLKSQICENIGLYAEKYSEEFDNYLPTFIQQVWNLLDSLDSSAKYDLLVSNAIRFLSIVAERGLHKEIFQKEEVLQKISTSVIIPNMKFRESDEELFEDNPEEYIRRDIEGADVQTRRRAACDFVKALSKHFEKPMTEVFSQYIESMLLNYSQNVQQNWKSKNAAIYLVTSLVVKGGSVRLGTTSTSDLINISDFFNNVIKCDLDRVDLNELPVLKADALKYIITFRNQLPLKEIIIPILPQISRHLTSPITIIHSYAANCIEKLLTLRDPNNLSATQIKVEEISAISLNILENLFNIFQFPGSGENDYAIKAIMRLFSLLRESILPYVSVLMPKLTQKLVQVSQNPSKPNFNHYLFECVCLLIKITCDKDPSAISSFESVLFPIFQHILVQDVQEFSSYVFEILAMLLEYHESSQQIPPPYMELFSFLLVPLIWERQANIAPVVRLIQAYIKCNFKEIHTLGKLEPLLGVFQKLISSKSNDHFGFHLVNYLVLYADPSYLTPFIKQIFFLLFQRLSSSKTVKFVKSLLVFFSLFICRYGATPFYQMIESIQCKMFPMVLEKLYIAESRKVNGLIDRKTVSIGMAKLLTDIDFFANDFAPLWPPLLEAIIAVFELPEEESTDDNNHFVELEENDSYQASYSRLVFATKKEIDPLVEIGDPKIYLAQNLSKLSQKYPGKLKPLIMSLHENAQNFLNKYLIICNVTIS